MNGGGSCPAGNERKTPPPRSRQVLPRTRQELPRRPGGRRQRLPPRPAPSLHRPCPIRGRKTVGSASSRSPRSPMRDQCPPLLVQQEACQEDRTSAAVRREKAPNRPARRVAERGGLPKILYNFLIYCGATSPSKFHSPMESRMRHNRRTGPERLGGRGESQTRYRPRAEGQASCRLRQSDRVDARPGSRRRAVAPVGPVRLHGLPGGGATEQRDRRRGHRDRAEPHGRKGLS